MKKTKFEKGITLIALIITIVVLLIIAGVAIGTLQESNIIGHAKDAVSSYEEAKGKEENEITDMEALLDEYVSGVKKEEDKEESSGDIVTPPQTEMPIAAVGTKVEQNSTIDGKEYSSTNPVIPAGFTAINVTGASWEAESGPEVDNGLVIRDELGNEFVWVPVTTPLNADGYGVGTTGRREPDVVTQVYQSGS